VCGALLSAFSGSGAVQQTVFCSVFERAGHSAASLTFAAKALRSLLFSDDLHVVLCVACVGEKLFAVGMCGFLSCFFLRVWISAGG
jgi:hypothetical protein